MKKLSKTENWKLTFSQIMQSSGTSAYTFPRWEDYQFSKVRESKKSKSQDNSYTWARQSFKTSGISGACRQTSHAVKGEHTSNSKTTVSTQIKLTCSLTWEANSDTRWKNKGNNKQGYLYYYQVVYSNKEQTGTCWRLISLGNNTLCPGMSTWRNICHDLGPLHSH